MTEPEPPPFVELSARQAEAADEFGEFCREYFPECYQELFSVGRSNSIWDNDRLRALKFLELLQWGTARQQLVLEEWNDALARVTGGPIGDEISSMPPTNITETSSPELLPIAERRYASALEVRDEFAKLKGSRPVKWCKSAPASQLGQPDAEPSRTTSFGSTK